jgi:hypothetical protein
MPGAVAFDQAGNLVISDNGDHQVRVLANTSGVYYGQKMIAGDIYTVAGNGTVGLSADGGVARAVALGGPQGVAVDKYGNVLLIDSIWQLATGTTVRVRVVAASTGTVDGTPALSADISAGPVAVDQAGNLLIASADAGTIWMVAERAGSYYGTVMHAGDVYTVAKSVGGFEFLDNCPVTRALFSAAGIAVQPGTGNLLIADSGSFRVRSVSR